MARVLLSHAASDRPRVRRLAEGLRRAGHQSWLIEDELRVSRSVLESLQQGLRDSDFVVACLSREALRTGWQEAELRLIIEGLPGDRADRLIPVRLEEVEPPASLQGRASIDVLEDRWDEGVASLAGLLGDAEKTPSGQTQAHGERLQRALSIERPMAGPFHPSVALRLSNLAAVRLDEGRLHEAQALFEQARDLLESRYGPESKDLGSILQNLGLTLLRMGKREQARVCFDKAILLLERMHGPDHPYVAMGRAGLFLTLEPGSAESRVEMERVFSTGLTLYLPERGPGEEQLQRALVLARSQQAQPAEVSHALSEALRAAEGGGSTANAARAALLLGAVLGSHGAWESAQEHLKHALRLSKQSEDDKLVAEAYRLLGDATLHGSHYEDARLNYAEAIRRYDALVFRQKAAKTRLLLLTMLLQLGRVQEIEPLLSPLREALAAGLFTDAQERTNTELALSLADSLRGPRPQGNTP